MPELPEVETIVRGLRGPLVGRRILAVRLGKTDFIDNSAVLERDLPGHSIQDVVRHGKFILLRLSTTNADASAGLLIHLGMTGRLALQRPNEPAAKHTHVFLSLDDGWELRYTDPRRFGRMALLTGSALETILGPLGLDPLEISRDDFLTRLGSRGARIKALLLDQHVLRGLGNIYADESLWRAKIHPARLGMQLSGKQLGKLHRAIGQVLRQAIQLGGSSISDFLGADGQPGEFQLHHRAYGREGKRCYRCRAKIRRIIVAGRSSYFCPRCQPAPREHRAKSRRRRAKTRSL